jgi:hypothetical protein
MRSAGAVRRSWSLDAPFGVGRGDDIGERGIPTLVEQSCELVEDAGRSLGSLKVAVPTWMASAPAAASSRASRPDATPPTPMIGAVGRRSANIAARTCQMARTAMVGSPGRSGRR